MQLQSYDQVPIHVRNRFVSLVCHVVNTSTSRLGGIPLREFRCEREVQ